MRRLLLLMLVAGLALPARAALFSDDEAHNKIARQQEELAQIKQKEQALDARVQAMETVLKNQGLLELLNRVEQMSQELKGLRGQLEVLSHEIESAQKRQKDYYVDLDMRLRRIEEQRVATPAPAAPAFPAAGVPAAGAAVVPVPGGTAGAMPAIPGAPAAGAAAAMPAMPAAPKPASPTAGIPAIPGAPGNAAPPLAKAVPAAPGIPAAAAVPAAPGATAPGVDPVQEMRSYDSAYNLFRIGDYAGSITSFRSFMQAYPTSKLAPNAQYWIGNAYYNMRDFKAAISSQQHLLATYPDSPKVPDAMLNMASSLLELNDNANAKRVLDDLVAKHPLSEAADKAKRRLATLN